MEYVTLIPWTPRTVLNTPEPEPQSRTICERTLDILQPIMFNALRPFPEARQALSRALLQFNDPAKWGLAPIFRSETSVNNSEHPEAENRRLSPLCPVQEHRPRKK